MGVKEKNGTLVGMVRTTASTAEHREATHKLPYSGGGEEDDYTRNIQIADLNALNAILAVVRWKKLVGFYGDIEREYHSLYTLNSNYIINAETAG